ncbi:hypothetical protein KP509_17G056700 [Ceratopteris richardii]|uniref:Peptidyl-prolyl cis-trans isomerase n=1 Tax=Ceratopteris richardii TaxID=49495 RepID=A0A8T2SVA3_CERRI|nr:hypothetical protein KP509_17G056700 [Ceratopteris richardii]
MSSGQKVRASHILVKHQGSRRPASFRDSEGVTIKATTRDAAIIILQAFRDAIEAGKVDFDVVAARYSDCSSAKRNGDLGWFARGQMQKPFEDVTYALNVGEMSGIVDTDSGVHIILRTG